VASSQETPRHVLLSCPDEEERREFLRETQGHLDPRKLLDTNKGAQVASRWMIKSGRIAKLQLAGQLLYEKRESTG